MLCHSNQKWRNPAHKFQLGIIPILWVTCYHLDFIPSFLPGTQRSINPLCLVRLRILCSLQMGKLGAISRNGSLLKLPQKCIIWKLCMLPWVITENQFKCESHYRFPQYPQTLWVEKEFSKNCKLTLTWKIIVNKFLKLAFQLNFKLPFKITFLHVTPRKWAWNYFWKTVKVTSLLCVVSPHPRSTCIKSSHVCFQYSPFLCVNYASVNLDTNHLNNTNKLTRVLMFHISLFHNY